MIAYSPDYSPDYSPLADVSNGSLISVSVMALTPLQVLLRGSRRGGVQVLHVSVEAAATHIKPAPPSVTPPPTLQIRD